MPLEIHTLRSLSDLLFGTKRRLHIVVRYI